MNTRVATLFMLVIFLTGCGKHTVDLTEKDLPEAGKEALRALATEICGVSFGKYQLDQRVFFISFPIFLGDGEEEPEQATYYFAGSMLQTEEERHSMSNRIARLTELLSCSFTNANGKVEHIKITDYNVSFDGSEAADLPIAVMYKPINVAFLKAGTEQTTHKKVINELQNSPETKMPESWKPAYINF